MAAEPSLFGVLDCAVDPALYEHAGRLAPHGSACLFEGRLHPEVAKVSPHVVELTPGDPLTRAWQGPGWGKAWGILIRSQAPLMVVRRRMRHFTQARLPSGEGPVLFRFWDPRVFRVYLPLVEPDQLGAWFTDLDSYLVETEDGAGVLRYAFRPDGLDVQTTAARSA